MAIVRLGPDGEREVIDPGAPEELAEAEAQLREVARALMAMAVRDRGAAGEPRAPPRDDAGER